MSYQKPIENLMAATTPERGTELRSIWATYGPQFSDVNDKPGFFLEGGPYNLILFTPRTLTYLWLLGFAAQRAFYYYSPVPILSQWMGRFDPALIDEIAIEPVDSFFRSIHEFAELEQQDDFNWPSQIPHPIDGKPTQLADVMAFDLLCMATAYIFLHEVRHLQLKKEPPAEGLSDHEEELECDRFAQTFLLKRVPEYSAQSGYLADGVRRKRTMSIALAIFFICAITPQKAWVGTRTHPPIFARIEELFDSTTCDANDHLWIYFSSLALAHLRNKKLRPTRISCGTFRDICIEVLKYYDAASS